MTETPQQFGARKGAALRAAKKAAAQFNQEIDVAEFGVRVHPDGSTSELIPRRLPSAPPRDAEPDNLTKALAAVADHNGDEADNEPVPMRQQLQQVEEKAARRAADVIEAGTRGMGVLELALQYQRQGLPEADALLLAQTKLGASLPVSSKPYEKVGSQLPTPATPGSSEELGPDPQMVAEYHRRMETYVPPKLTGKLTVEVDGDIYTCEVPVRFLDYLQVVATWEGTKRRRRDWNPAQMLELILRRAKAADQEAAIRLHGGGTGPKNLWNPEQGAWA
ncbi:MAG: hypothetical protein QNJ94_18660 [Alphaproteobacteria bacterium]|nr:hypothetical protein [Alphaproteobacteria bacterium]